MEIVVGIIALALAALIGTGKLNLESITSLFKPTPISPVTNIAVPNKEEACKAVITLMQYTLVINGDMEPLVTLARSIYHGAQTNEA